ncbi:MAG TPA: hypothetical protein PLA71_00905 [Saccharofermentans sp.]|nr:hypothetical protein [Saccharofermentans sp.]
MNQLNELKLIVENDPHELEYILEQKNERAPGFLRIKGPYIVTEKKNANGRIYSRSLMEKSVADFKTNYIDKCVAFGEMNHPDHNHIDYNNICHKIVSLTQEEDIWIGESVVLMTSADGTVKGTPKGDILASVIHHGGKPGMSTRGVGKLSEGNVVKDQYKMITIDCVSNPSGPNCYVNGILESKTFMIDTYGDIVEKAFEQFQRNLESIPTHSIKTDEGSKHLIESIKNFIDSLKV